MPHLTRHFRNPTRCLAAVGMVLAQLLLAPALRAAESIVILNSDSSVERYNSVQEIFKQNLKQPTLEINLGSKFADQRQIERQLRHAKPDLIYCIGTRAYDLAHILDRDRTIVISSAINVKRLPLGGRTYGIANEVPAATQLTYFRYFFPEVKRIGVLYSTTYNQQSFDEAVLAGGDVSIQVTGARVNKPGDLRRAIGELLPNVDALWLISDPIVLSANQSVAEIFRQAAAARKPIFTYNPAYVDAGAVLAISPDTPTIGRQAAGLAAELMGRKTIADRFQQPAGSEIILNLRKANEYSMKLNVDALSSVNRLVR